MKARPIMIQGTMSNAGKSLLAAALCRALVKRGMKVAPFKSQNMALNSYVTKAGEEMGRAQVVQAEAAKILPDARMNPVLLKPTTDVGSQVIVMGKAIGNMTAAEYFRYKKNLLPQILNAYTSLAQENDVIVIEGAGSPVEMNLNDNDIVNMGLAKLLKAPVLLVGDIDRGGIFAQLCGTVSLFTEEEKKLLKGLIVNKFRGDGALFEEGRKMLEERTGYPVLGVMPYAALEIDDEDSLSERLNVKARGEGADVAVIRLPKLSNFTDFAPFEHMEGASLRYVEQVEEFGDPDLVLIPGTKSTLGDLQFLKDSGLAEQIIAAAHRNVPVFGICGGFQILGESVSDPLGKEGGGSAKGLGLLPIQTVFGEEKTLRETSGVFGGLSGIFSCLNGLSYSGYEIHMGESNVKNAVTNVNNVYGSYVHGIFDEKGIAQAMVSALCERSGKAVAVSDYSAKENKEKNYDKLAAVFEANVDMDAILKIITRGV